MLLLGQNFLVCSPALGTPRATKFYSAYTSEIREVMSLSSVDEAFLDLVVNLTQMTSSSQPAFVVLCMHANDSRCTPVQITRNISSICSAKRRVKP